MSTSRTYVLVCCDVCLLLACWVVLRLLAPSGFLVMRLRAGCTTEVGTNVEVRR